ncbi:PREDICTED: transcription factor HES-3-like [Nicrophorus vespilloides]|uniref:Transcription factor HES-3-like n=1 Tax=Nicrophorus vespilloides TaxID=110193 RepID=A0ABM1MWN4_NICVS|nr:PREDICTED: transcription factor HES-3-like [Nicrophorus vespilloides]
MEKKRRARINDSLETLKQILLESKTSLKEVPCKKSGSSQRTAKLEKADILEMTVTYIQNLKNHLNRVQAADSSCNVVDQRLKVGLTLVPTRLGNGDLAFVIPPQQQDEKYNNSANQENVWRPW